MNHPTAFASGQQGLSLTEMLLVFVIVAGLVVSTLPAINAARLRRHLDGVAAQLETDILLARSEAVSLGRSVRISFRPDANGTCYVVHTGPADACNCSADGTAQCANGQFAVRSVRLGKEDAVQLQSNVPSILFDSTKGTSTPTGTIRLTAQQLGAVHLVVNIIGRVRSCSPDGAVPGYKAC